jgi:hypothetical protein
VIDWPQTLVKEIARRRCVLFLGAGVSAAATDDSGGQPKDWPGFLEEACSLVRGEQNQSEVREMIAERRYLLCLQAIAEEADTSDYHNLLDHHFNNPAFQAGELHQIVRALDSRIVITTNFDKIYERLCLTSASEGYKVIPYYSGSLGDELRSDTRIIVKAHGTIDEIQRMVFTKAEYHRAKRDHPDFYALLKSIFLTHTCVFIGCSLDDPDVLLVLEDVRVTASSQRPHYSLIRTGGHSHYALRDWEKAYNIRALDYGPNHGGLVESLRDLHAQVDALRQSNPQA